jgi:hypothetical protein
VCLLAFSAAVILGSASTALAQEQVGEATKSTADLQFLRNYDVVIGDTGDRHYDWDSSETRVYVQLRDNGRYDSLYFDSLPAAYFVLNEMYNNPDVVVLGVQEYPGSRQRYTSPGSLLEARSAYYVWDDQHYSRGGLPLVLAFASYQDAVYEARQRDALVMDYEGLRDMLAGWRAANSERVYWRGWDRDRWDRDKCYSISWGDWSYVNCDNGRWDRAYRNRWDGWDWDSGDGWIRISIDNDDDSWDRDRERDRGGWKRRGRGHGMGRGRGRN